MIIALPCLAVLFLVYILGVLFFSPDEHSVENNQGVGVEAAINLHSCELLAVREFGKLTAGSHAAYHAAVESGDVLLLTNGTTVKQETLLNLENGRLVPWKASGPITAAEEERRHLGVYMWVVVVNGLQKGKKVCVSPTTLRGMNPTL